MRKHFDGASPGLPHVRPLGDDANGDAGGGAVFTQVEADGYISEPKSFPLPTAVPLKPGVDKTYTLTGDISGTDYLLDIWRGSVRLTRVKFQNRVQVSTVLVRIDDARHTNPDGEQFDGWHIHTYREGYEDKWAQHLDPAFFPDTADTESLFRGFCTFCNIDHGQVVVQVSML